MCDMLKPKYEWTREVKADFEKAWHNSCKAYNECENDYRVISHSQLPHTDLILGDCGMNPIFIVSQPENIARKSDYL